MTLRAMVLIGLARLLIALVPFRIWRDRLGPRPGALEPEDLRLVRRLAAHVARAAWRAPGTVKCLPQAAALSWQLRRRGIAHQIVFAVRPAQLRGGKDDLHAWIVCTGEVVLGDLPGPWLEVLTLPPG